MKQNERTYVISGATSGIGLAVAKTLVEKDCNIIGVGRSPERCEIAKNTLREMNPSVKTEYCLADLSEQKQVCGVARQIQQQLKEWNIPYLDGLVNNAAVVPFRQAFTVDGFDMQWAVNYLSGFLLSNLLLGLMSQAPFARIVSVSSASHYHTRMHWNDLQMTRFYNPLTAYKRSKLAQVLFIAELNRRLNDKPNIKAFAADPGLVRTDIGLKGKSDLMSWIWKVRRQSGISPGIAARGIVYLLTEPSIQNATQIYWKHGQPQDPHPCALDEEAGKRLWELSEKMCGIIKESDCVRKK